MYWISLSLLILLLPCGNLEEKNNIGQKNRGPDTISKMVNLSTNTFTTVKERDSLASAFYEYKNDTLSQRLEVTYISDQQISFKLTSVNKTKGKMSNLAGIAKVRANDGPEMDVDDEGYGYATYVYYFTRDNCTFSIKIDKDTKDKAKIHQYNRDRLHYCSSNFA